MAAYDAVMELWPVPYEEIDLSTQFGTTHVVVSGPEDAPPLVLLHGFMNTLTIWIPNVTDLSKAYRLYAVDTMSQPSKSIPSAPMRSARDFVVWLGETLDGLGLDQTPIAGISYGAWIAINFALTNPQRVRKLVLLSPAGSFQPLATQFAMRAVLSGIIPTRGMMNSFFKWMGLEALPDDPFTERLLDLIWLGGTHFQNPPGSKRVMSDELPDEALRALRLPVLLLMGENEVIYDSEKALDRARRLVPDLEGDLVADARHNMSASRPELVDARILAFLEGS